jgi:hypothetical protein
MAPAYLDRTRFLTRDALAPLLDGRRQPNSDFFPILDFGAELTRFKGDAATGIGWASDADFDPTDVFLPPLGPVDELGPAPIPTIRAFAALDLGTRLRKALATAPDSSELSSDPGVQESLENESLLEGLLSGEGAPADWGSFMGLARVVSVTRHGGLRGWADEDFYDRLERFATAHGAPDGLVTSLRFDRAVRAHDWTVAAAAAVQLVPSSTSASAEFAPWIDLQLTLDAGVIALLMTGRIGEARHLFDTLSPRVWHPDTAYMTLFLPAYLEYAEASGGFAGARAP